VNSKQLDVLLTVAFGSVRTSQLPVSEAPAAAAAAAVPAEFPGIIEAHAEGRLPGRVNPDTSSDSQPGKQ